MHDPARVPARFEQADKIFLRAPGFGEHHCLACGAQLLSAIQCCCQDSLQRNSLRVDRNGVGELCKAAEIRELRLHLIPRHQLESGLLREKFLGEVIHLVHVRQDERGDGHWFAVAQHELQSLDERTQRCGDGKCRGG